MACKRSTVLTDYCGFTLVEGLVAGTISVIVGGIIITLLHMNGNTMRQTTLNSRVQMQYDAVLEEIARTARAADQIVATDELPCRQQGWTGTTARTATAIEMFDDNCNRIGGFRINGVTALQEFTNGAWVNFRVGANDVSVVSGGIFSLSSDRKWLTVNLSVFSANGSVKDTSVSKLEVLACRN